jgi:subtilisin family serine protease
VRYAHRHGAVLVAATGNGGRRAETYPAAYPEVIAVAGTADARDAPDPQSNTGDYVDLAAPSLNIVGPGATGDGFVLWDRGGTSFAAPFVAGAAALVRSYRPDLSADEVARRLEASADHPADGRDARVGYGVVNPYRAVTTVLGTPGSAPAAPGALPAATHRGAAADGTRTTFLVAAGGVLAAVLLLLVAVAVVPRGIRRGWRPGLRASLPGPRPTGRRYPAFDPATAPREPPRPVEPVRVTSGDFTVDVTFR